MSDVDCIALVVQVVAVHSMANKSHVVYFVSFLHSKHTTGTPSSLPVVYI